MAMNEPVKSDDIPVTKRMLDERASELKSEITSVRLEMKAGFNSFGSRFNSNDARFDSIESKIEGLISAVHRTNAIVEEQNARNRYVLDGYASIYDNQKKTEVRVENLEKSVFGKGQV